MGYAIKRYGERAEVATDETLEACVALCKRHLRDYMQDGDSIRTWVGGDGATRVCVYSDGEHTDCLCTIREV